MPLASSSAIGRMHHAAWREAYARLLPDGFFGRWIQVEGETEIVELPRTAVGKIDKRRLGATVTTTGQSNWFKGAQLLALYLIIAAILYLIPVAAP